MIIHILQDGTCTDSVTGMVIKASEHKALYELINRIQKNKERKNHGSIIRERHADRSS